MSTDPSPDGSSIIGQLILIVVLTTINALFAAAEMAMVSLDMKRIEKDADEGDKKSRRIVEMMAEQSRFLSVIQVAITFAGFFNSASAATGISQVLGQQLQALNVPYSSTIAMVIITLVLSYFTLVFGELVPKRIALQQPEKFSKAVIGVLTFVSKALSPFVTFLTLSTNAVLRLIGIDPKGVEERVTMGDIRSIIQVGQEQGLINPVESEMINSVIGFDDLYAEEIMTARPEVFMIDVADDVDEYLGEMLNLKYSRIPVYEDDVDNIIGVLYIKDFLLEAYKVGFDKVNIRKIIKPAYFVPERKNINELFMELQNSKRHLAVLIDEYGGFAGIVTMEDLIEEIVGDIDDEYDHDEPELLELQNNTFIAKGSISIKELNFRIGADIDEDSEDYDTLGGLIIFLLGYIPLDNEKIALDYENLELRVEHVEDKRIQEVFIRVNDLPNELEEGSDEDSATSR